jgi:predicted lactoylglutathione lyase
MSDHDRPVRPLRDSYQNEVPEHTPTGVSPLSKMIFINLPVTDLPRAVAFYEAVGATKNPQFSDDTAACMVLSETIHAMLLTHDKYRQFTSKKIIDAKTSSEVLICVSADSRAEVDGLVSKATAAGGSADPTPTQDYGFMYGRSYEDPDGHIWEVMWMDMAAAQAAMAKA